MDSASTVASTPVGGEADGLEHRQLGPCGGFCTTIMVLPASSISVKNTAPLMGADGKTVSASCFIRALAGYALAGCRSRGQGAGRTVNALGGGISLVHVLQAGRNVPAHLALVVGRGFVKVLPVQQHLLVKAAGLLGSASRPRCREPSSGCRSCPEDATAAADGRPPSAVALRQCSPTTTPVRVSRQRRLLRRRCRSRGRGRVVLRHREVNLVARPW